MFAKIEVNGDHAHPLYRYLKDEKPGLLGHRRHQVEFHQIPGGPRRRSRVARYAPQTKPEELEEPIRALL